MSGPTIQRSLGFEFAGSEPEQLRQWPPERLDLEANWATLVNDFFASQAGLALSARLADALAAGKRIYPPEPFRALFLTPFNEVRVVILGQDPYHQPGQAEGLAFSVASGVRFPPSLRNIFKELQQSLALPTPSQGSLVHWAKQGVLLLNTSLTVEDGKAASHARWGWEHLTDALVMAVARKEHPVVFMLWGAHAQTKKDLIESTKGHTRHLILEANHPSPLSALRPPLPFLGCGHFAKAVEFWNRLGEKHVKW